MDENIAAAYRHDTMPDRDTARFALGLMDLTSLNADADDASTRALAASAATPFGAPAALCIHARFLPVARRALDAHGLQAVRLAAVANFPAGEADAAAAARQTAAALALGADEVDVVFPWRALMAGDAACGARLVAACRAACDSAGHAGATPAARSAGTAEPPATGTGTATRGPIDAATTAETLATQVIETPATGRRLLKVILETGELATPPLIRLAAETAIAAGADFIKTSTGKVPVNATLPAARLMLEAIRDGGAAARHVGFKAAGGVRTLHDAAAYLALADRVMGAGWAGPRTFRFGASGLLGALLATLTEGVAAETTSGGVPARGEAPPAGAGY